MLPSTNHNAFHVSDRFTNYYKSSDFISIILVLDPHIEFSLNGKRVYAKDKCVLVTGGIRNIEVVNKVVPENSYIVQINSVTCNIDFTDLYLNNIIIDYFDNYYRLDLSDPDMLYQVEGTLSEIEQEHKQNAMLTNKMIRLLTERFFVKFLRYYLTNEEQLQDTFTHHIIADFIKLVNIHYRDKKKLIDYAELLYISPKTLSNIFTKADFNSPAQIIKNKIVKEAKTMASTNPSISGKEVAFKLGYQNPNNFFVLFRNKEGVSFTSYCASIS